MRHKIVQKILEETPQETKIFIDKYTDLVVRINQILHEKDYTQKSLAEKLDKQPSEISKWLNGQHNFTLRSIAKLEAELGETLLNVPERKAKNEFVDGYIKKTHTFTSYRKVETKTTKTPTWEKAIIQRKLSNVG